MLASTLRTADVVARVGGDEFAVILTGARAAADAAVAAERINQRLAERVRQQELRYPITVSIGIAFGAPGTAFNLQGLLRDADEAMYAHKRKQRSD